MKKLLLALALLVPSLFFAQQVQLFQQFNGRLDFTAFGNTLNEFPNTETGYCDMLPQSSATLALTSGQTFMSAHLYWGSIGTGDFDVELNGTAISAQRIFSHTFNGLPYFGAYADVTNLVATTGNGVYTFSGLDVAALLPNYCGTNFGGWAIYVIYGDPSLRLNQISLFDGLESVSATNPNLDITLTNIDVTSDILSKIGFLAWEGEESLAVNETLTINGILIDNPPLNPGTNAFNGTNTYTNSGLNYNMDLDFYDLVGIVQPGDTSADIRLTSGQDFVMVNNVITSVNSEIPDATIEIDNIGVLCQNNNMDVEYTVYNVNSTAPLALNTPIAFYADAVLIGQAQTVADIPIGGSESGVITLNIPIATPNIFNLRAVVDDIGDGTGVVAETNESNNEDSELIDLSLAGIFLGNNIEACIGTGVVLDTGLTDPPFNIQWFRAGIPIPGATNPTYTVTADGIYSVEARDGICFVPSNQVSVHFNPQPVANPPVDLFQCDFGTTTGVFDLTVNDANVLGAQNPLLFNIKYYEDMADAVAGVPGTEILGPTVHLIVPPSPQTIYVRIEDLSGTCFDIEQFDIFFSRAIAGIVPPFINVCDADQDGGEWVNLSTEFNALILDGELSSDYFITYHLSQADADGDTGALPDPYFVNAPNEVIYIRLENRDDDTCFDTTRNVDIIIDTPPTINASPPTLIQCDPNNDGFDEFDLTVQTPIITLGDPTLTVTYHGTLLDAQNDLLPFPDPTAYINDDIYLDEPITDPLDPLYGTGGVWARVVSSVSSCNSVVPFALEVRFAPVATTPADPLRMCDDAVADGFTSFDLTVVEMEVLGAMSPSEFDVYYYELEADAIAAGDVALTAPDYSAAIPDPTDFINSINPQEIYILVVGNNTSTVPPNPNSGEGCYDIVPLTLIVDPIPEDLGPFEINLCDDDLNGSTLTDEISTFDLTTQDALINGGITTTIVEWFETPADELANNPIPDPTAYQNISTPQTVVARVTSEFGCLNTVTVTLTVFPNPNPKTDPTPLELCDDDDDGIVNGFDPSLRDIEIIDGEPDVSVLYYEDLADAEAGLPGTEITAPYQGFNNQIIYARVTKDVPPAILACYTIVELELIVIPLPDMPDATFQDPFIACDESGNGQAIFDLTLQDPGVYGVQNPGDFVNPITYYEDPADAAAATNAIATPNAFLSGGQPIWVRLESLITGCVRITEFQIEVGLFPTTGVGDNLLLCDDDLNGSTLTDEISTFDLTVNTALIDLGDPTLNVVYYASAADQAANIPITTPEAYQNVVVPQQQIFVSAFTEQGCRATSVFFITVLPNPVPGVPTPLELCDDDDDGEVDGFDLTLKDTEIMGAEINVSVLYYETEAAANAGLPGTEIVGPYTGSNNQIIYARLTRDVPPAVLPCYTIVELQLIVIPLPDMPDATFQNPFISCDADGTGQAEFDLTLQDPAVYGVQNPGDFVSPITYYEDPADAAAGTNFIDPANAFVSTGQTIWVRLESMITGCVRITEFEIEVGLFPTIGVGDDLSLCDDDINGSTFVDGLSTFDLTVNDPLINLGDPTLSVVYYASAADQAANIPITTPEAYQNIVNPQEIFVTGISDQDCEARNSFFINVLPNPAAVTPTPFVACDADNNGFALFDLTEKDLEITGGEPGVTVTYYENPTDAQAGIFAIDTTDPYQNLSTPTQPIWARAEFTILPNDSGCFTIVEFDLIVSPTPVVPATLDPISMCDTDLDGVETFDLTIYENADGIYGTQDPMDFSPITYYISQLDAETPTNEIIDPTAFVSGGQTIYYRLEFLATECFKIGTFELEVPAGPTVIAPTSLVYCDDLGEPFDGITSFDLTDKNDEITGGAPGVGVRYYPTEADAQNDENQILPDTAYVNDSSPFTDIVWARVDNNAECFNITSLDLVVRPNPAPVTPDPIELCDVTVVIGPNADDNVEIFDLTIRETQILNGGNEDLTYHLTYEDALDNLNAIVDPTAHQNTDAGGAAENPQTIYVRVTNNNTAEACFEIVELVLIVNPLPDDTAVIEDMIICEIGNDGVGTFDLTTKVDEILNGQDPTIHEVTFYENPTDAAAGTFPIVNPDNYISDGSVSPPGQPIYVGILNTETNCYVASEEDIVSGEYSLSFFLQVLEGAVANPPINPYVLCDADGPNDGFTSFDLTFLDADILLGQPYNVDYYETFEFAELGDLSNALPTNYTNIINPQIIYARVTNPDTGCYDITSTVLKVEQVVTVALDETYRLCLDENGNPIVEEFGSSSPPVLDTGFDPGNQYSIQWELNGTTILGEVGPSIIALQGGEYTVIITDLFSGCTSSTTTTVTESSPPVTYSAEVVNGAFANVHTIEVTAEGLGEYIYQLDDGVFQESTTFENVEPGNHTITITDANGCGTVTIEVGIIDYPRFVTPNQDGYNDTWNIIGIANGDPTANIYIFDRYGKLLKQISPLGEGWDGTYNGNPLPSSDYWFVVEYTEDDVRKEFKGHFTLKR